MATQSIAAMLDGLMGKYRNAMPSERPKDPSWDDDEVCKHFLVSFCPHEMFTNTKADLGPCDKLHDEKLKEKYRQSSRFEKMGYDDAFLAFLQKLHSNMENKIRRNKSRLDLTQPDGQATDANKQRLEEKIKIMSEKINSLLHQAESLGAEGKVNESQAIIDTCDNLRDEREQLRETLEHSISQDKLMEVCEVCGCFLIVGDTASRIEEHLLGKQHMGYAKIKATIDELIRRKEEKKKSKDSEEHKRQKRSRSRETKRDKESHASKRRSQEADERKPRRRSRSRSRDREAKRSSASRSGAHSESRRAERSERRRRSRSRSSDRSTQRPDKSRRSRERNGAGSNARASASEEKVPTSAPGAV